MNYRTFRCIRLRWRAVLTTAVGVSALLMFAVYAARQLTNGHNWGDDFGLYLHIADNIRQGRPYAWLVRGIIVPPGFPLMLAGWEAVFGASFATLKLINVVAWVIATAIAALFAMRTLGKSAAIVVLALNLALPDYFILQQSILTDIPSLVFSNFALLSAAFSQSKQASRRWMWAVLANVAMLLALSLRPAALPLAAAFVGGALWSMVVNRFERTSIHAGFVLIGGAVVVLIINFLTFGATTSAHTQNALGFIDSNDVVGSLLRSVIRRAGEEFDNFSILFFGYPIAPWNAIGLLVYGAIGAIVYVFVTRDGVAPAFFVAYFAFLLLTPWQGGPRYLLPLLMPFSLFVTAPFGAAITAMPRLTTSFWRSTVTILTLLTFAFHVALGHSMMLKVRQEYGFNDDEISDLRTQQLLNFLRSKTSDEDVICSQKPRAIMLFVKRAGCNLIPTMPKPYSNYIKSEKARFAVVILRQSYGFSGLDADLASDQGLSQVFRNDDYSVYRLSDR